MEPKELEEQIVKNYQKDEHMMILVFAQWCVNNDLDPIDVYTRAYPSQSTNPELIQAMELTVPKEESEYIADETVFGVLSLFGNDDLAMVMTDILEKRNKKK